MDVGEVPVLGAGSCCCCCSCCGLRLVGLEAVSCCCCCCVRMRDLSSGQTAVSAILQPFFVFCFFPFFPPQWCFFDAVVVNRITRTPIVDVVVFSLMGCCNSVDLEFK